MYPKRQVFLVLGLSRSGTSATAFLLERGAKVFLYDDVQSERLEKTAAELEEKGAKRIKREDLERVAERCDALVLSPGIPIDHPIAVAFKRAGKAVIGETELAARTMRCPIVAITGTNGKTTTFSLLTEILKKGGIDAYACGNIGAPMVDFCGLGEDAVAVAEISSFQLETLNSLRPHVAIVLNVTEDHLNRHYTMENYVFLKRKLLKNLTEAEYAALNYDDETVRGFAENTKARVLWFSLKERVNGAYLENGAIYFNGEKVIPINELFSRSMHNVQNALAGVVAAKLMGVDTVSIATALSTFKGIAHRLEFIAEINGIKYVNDSKATNVDAAIKGVRSIATETVLLLGGKDKGYDYDKLFSALKESSVVQTVLYGENRYKLLNAARKSGWENVTLCRGFSVALPIATMQARSGQTVLLSPASASFDEFASYEERGETFVKYVDALKEKYIRNVDGRSARIEDVEIDGDDENVADKESETE